MQEIKEYLFDFKEMDFVTERILEKYLLRGKLKEYSNSFLVVCDKDIKGENLTYNFSLERIGRLIQSQRKTKKRKGLNFNSFTNPFEELLQKSQWFSRFNYYEPTTIVSEGKTIYDLTILQNENKIEKSGIISHYLNMDGIFNAGHFQGDKLWQDRVLISDVNSKRLDEMIRDIYRDRIRENY